MAEQVFTQEGRRYVSGDRAHRCDYAYLETPRVGEWNGLLIIKARFSGRKAFDVLGRCVGLGDEIDLTIAATPVVKRGVLTLADVKVDTGGKNSFSRRVSAALRDSLERQFGLMSPPAPANCWNRKTPRPASSAMFPPSSSARSSRPRSRHPRCRFRRHRPLTSVARF